MNARWSLIVGIVAMVAWIILGFVVPLGAGWVHLLLAVGMMLLIRGVVVGGNTSSTTGGATQRT
jgi:hypothetical protein